MRPVPRNIDRPNRNAEYTFTALGTYYGLMFMFHDPMVAMGSALLAVYLMYKLTLDKPEGAAYRLWYKFLGIGKMVPNPKKVRKFEIG